MLRLPDPDTTVLVHGDFGHHNVLWQGTDAVSLIDVDNACIGDPANDIAPLIGSYGARQVAQVASDELLHRGMAHRATLSLQVAAAAQLAGRHALRDHALSYFIRRNEAGTLYDPEGITP